MLLAFAQRRNHEASLSFSLPLTLWLVTLMALSIPQASQSRHAAEQYCTDVISPRFKLNMTKGICATYRRNTLVDCVIWLPSEHVGSAQGQASQSSELWNLKSPQNHWG